MIFMAVKTLACQDIATIPPLMEKVNPGPSIKDHLVRTVEIIADHFSTAMYTKAAAIPPTMGAITGIQA